MNIKTIGRFVFTIPFAFLGLMHFMNAKMMAGMVPSFIPGGIFWVYLIGLALLAASVSFVIEKHTYLAALLTAALMLIFSLTIYLPDLLGGNQMAMPLLLKELGLAGGALLLAAHYEDK